MASSQIPATGADYDLLEKQVVSLLEDERNFLANAANFAAFVFSELPAINWAGFYFPDEGGLVLGPFGGKPACTRLPDGRGVCGAAFKQMQTMVVDDVNAFPDHIVCDSASQSEIVVPLIFGGAIVGVFDVDSPVRGRFSDYDKAGLERLVARFVEYSPLPDAYKPRHARDAHAKVHADIQTCREHHVILRYLADELSRTNATPGAGLQLLSRLRTVLLAHLKLEDDWLYPQLRKSSNETVRRKAERYGRELGDLSRRFDKIWEAWNKAGAIEANPQIWQHDWNAFRQVLLARIGAEDNDLYAAVSA